MVGKKQKVLFQNKNKKTFFLKNSTKKKKFRKFYNTKGILFIINGLSFSRLLLGVFPSLPEGIVIYRTFFKILRFLT